MSEGKGEFSKCGLRVGPIVTPLWPTRYRSLPLTILRGSFSLVSSHHHGTGTVLPFGGGAPRRGATVWRGAAAGGGGSVRQGQREGQGCVRWRGQGVSIPILGTQDGRRWKRERQRETCHVEKPANAARHLRRWDHRTVRTAHWALCHGSIHLKKKTISERRREAAVCRGRLV